MSRKPHKYWLTRHFLVQQLSKMGLYMVMVFSSTNTLHLCFQPMGKSQTYSCYNDFPSSHNAHKVL